MRLKGYEIIPLVRSHSSLEKEILVDFNSSSIAIDLFKIPPCQAIVHLASRIDFTNQLQDSDFFGATVNTTSALVNLANFWNAHLIFSSSISVYEENDKISFSSPINPKSPYARTKLLAEKIIQTSGLNKFTIFRYGGIVGLTHHIHLGINKFLLLALKNKIPPTIYGDGKSKRNYLYVKDAAKSIMHAIETDTYGTYLVAGSEILNIKQMAEQICHTFLPGQYPIYQHKMNDSPDCIIESSDLFQAEFNFETALQDIQSEYKDFK